MAFSAIASTCIVDLHMDMSPTYAYQISNFPICPNGEIHVTVIGLKPGERMTGSNAFGSVEITAASSATYLVAGGVPCGQKPCKNGSFYTLTNIGSSGDKIGFIMRNTSGKDEKGSGISNLSK